MYFIERKLRAQCTVGQTMQIPERAAELLTQRKRNEKEGATVFHSEFRLLRQDYHYRLAS